MKKLIMLLGILLISLTSIGQIGLTQSIVEPPPYKVGDVITIRYAISKETTNPRYFWFRYTYNTSALAYVPNSTTFSQGNSAQTYYTTWNNYTYIPPVNTIKENLYQQYQATPWKFIQTADWLVGQLAIQRVDAPIDGVVATQKYIVKDNYSYDSIFKLAMAYAINSNGTMIPSITGNVDISLGTVIGNITQFKVKVAYPIGYSISDHTAQLMPLKSDGSNQIDWTQQPIASQALDINGEATFTTNVRVGDSLGVFITPTFGKSYMNNIVTVSDAYKAFLGYTETDIMGNSTFFTYPSLEKRVALITKNKTEFSESDSYNMFAHTMGIDVSNEAMIPTSTSQSIKWQSGLLNQNWLDGNPTNNVIISSINQTANMVYAWGGDLNWSHSTDPSLILSNILNVNSPKLKKSVSPINDIKPVIIGAYRKKEVEKATLSVTSAIEGGKVVLLTSLTKEGLAGLQVIMNYDESKLTLDNIIFDSGTAMTNFSTNKDGRLTFGSIDQLKTARIKIGTPYKLIFTPKTTLTNTSGLFYFVLSDAVDGAGNKIDLIIE